MPVNQKTISVLESKFQAEAPIFGRPASQRDISFQMRQNLGSRSRAKQGIGQVADDRGYTRIGTAEERPMGFSKGNGNGQISYRLLHKEGASLPFLARKLGKTAETTGWPSLSLPSLGPC